MSTSATRVMLNNLLEEREFDQMTASNDARGAERKKLDRIHKSNADYHWNVMCRDNMLLEMYLDSGERVDVANLEAEGEEITNNLGVSGSDGHRPWLKNGFYEFKPTGDDAGKKSYGRLKLSGDSVFMPGIKNKEFKRANADAIRLVQLSTGCHEVELTLGKPLRADTAMNMIRDFVANCEQATDKGRPAIPSIEKQGLMNLREHLKGDEAKLKELNKLIEVDLKRVADKAQDKILNDPTLRKSSAQNEKSSLTHLKNNIEKEKHLPDAIDDKDKFKQHLIAAAKAKDPQGAPSKSEADLVKQEAGELLKTLDRRIDEGGRIINALEDALNNEKDKVDQLGKGKDLSDAQKEVLSARMSIVGDAQADVIQAMQKEQKDIESTLKYLNENKDLLSPEQKDSLKKLEEAYDKGFTQEKPGQNGGQPQKENRLESQKDKHDELLKNAEIKAAMDKQKAEDNKANANAQKPK